MEHSKLGPNRLYFSPQLKDFQINGQKPGELYWQVGMMFMQDYYTIFDWENKRVGIVSSNHDAA